MNQPVNDTDLNSLIERLDELHQIFDTAATGMRVIDTDFRIVQMNKSFCKLAGVTTYEALTKECYSVFPGKLCHTSECPLTQIVKGKNRIECFVEKKNKKGHSVQCLMTATPLHNNSGGLTGIVEHFIDINHISLANGAPEQNGTKLIDRDYLSEDFKTTLKILFDENSQYRKEIEDSVLLNVSRLISPCIEQLKNTRLTIEQKTLISSLELNLNNITSPFIKRLSSKLINLTPSEMEVAKLVKEGKTNDEIAEILCLSKNTVLTHRYHMRTKLKLKSKKINLRMYLQTLDE